MWKFLLIPWGEKILLILESLLLTFTQSDLYKSAKTGNSNLISITQDILTTERQNVTVIPCDTIMA